MPGRRKMCRLQLRPQQTRRRSWTRWSSNRAQQMVLMPSSASWTRRSRRSRRPSTPARNAPSTWQPCVGALGWQRSQQCRRCNVCKRTCVLLQIGPLHRQAAPLRGGATWIHRLLSRCIAGSNCPQPRKAPTYYRRPSSSTRGHRWRTWHPLIRRLDAASTAREGSWRL